MLYQTDIRECDDDYTLSDDRKGRDFTVNAIYGWPNDSYTAFEFDFPEHGEEDVKRKIVRTNNSFEETFGVDPGRYLRALRLEM